MNTSYITVGIDIGSFQHRVAIADPNGNIIDEFDLAHHKLGFCDFFKRLAEHEKRMGHPVAIAMEGFNGHARPLDTQIRMRGYPLYNVNNLKLARFKEIFPGPAKSDPIDARKILELFQLRTHLPVAKDVLQEVAACPAVNEQLKRLTRRRRQLVNDKVSLVNRLQADLKAVVPGLLEITGSIDNRWFLNFLTYRKELASLARIQKKSILGIKGVGDTYAEKIVQWQNTAYFAPEVDWVGDMIIEDARRVLELMNSIERLEKQIEPLVQDSEIAGYIQSIPGFGIISSAELAGEIGTVERFATESSLALYIGMAALTNQSGACKGTKTPRQVNKRAKAAMMVAVARHINHVPSSKRYYDKKRSEGKKHNQAIRALGRHLTRVIWALIKNQRDYEMR